MYNDTKTIYTHGLTLSVVDRRWWWKTKRRTPHIIDWPLELEGPGVDALLAASDEWDVPAILQRQAD